MTDASHAAEPRRFFVEAALSGGWAVKLHGHPTPVSRHDTEEDADAKAAAYVRGAQRTAQSHHPPDRGAAPAVGQPRLRCARCGDVIGSYEPCMVVSAGESRVTTKAAEPRLAQAGELFHRACFALTTDRPETLVR